MKMKINEKKNYLISEIAGSKAIFTKRNVFNFSRFFEMNQDKWVYLINFLEKKKKKI